MVVINMSLYIATSSFNEWLSVLTPEFRKTIQQEEKYVLRLLKKGYNVLEVGSGTGRLLAIVAPHVEEAVGVEHEYLQVHVSEKSLPKNARVVYADAGDLPFNDDEFDLTVSVFNFLGNQGDNKFSVLREKRRVTKPDGNIIASVYAENALDYQMKQYKIHQEMLGRHGHETSIKTIDDTTLLLTDGYPLFTSERFSKDKLARLFRDTGFTSFDIDNIADFSYVVNARK